MRLFTGIELPAEVAESLDRVMGRLRPTARVNWSPVANLHITTKFIGEWPASRLEEMKAALRRVPAGGPIAISAGELGWFPNAQAPRVLFAGVKTDGALARLAGDTGRAAESLGVAGDTRRYSPHLTLARIKTPAGLERLREAVAALCDEPFGAFVADRFYLYLSERGAAGSVYTKLEEFPLDRS